MTDFTVKAGKHRKLVLIYKNIDKSIINITGSSARLMLRKSLFSPVVATVIATIDGPNGKITFPFVPADTANILEADREFEEFVYDVEFTNAANETDILLKGTCIVELPVTRT